MDNLERIRLSRKQRRLSRKWSLETDDNIESNQLENETRNDIYELKDNSEDQLEVSEENSWKNEKEIKQFRQNMPERRKKRVLKRDKTLKVTTSDITKINEIKKVKEKEVLSSTSSNGRLSTNRLHHKSRKRIHDPSSNIEIPITEILRKYEEPVPPTPLTTDKIYIQGDNGFSMVKIITKEDDRRNVLKFLSKGRLSKQIYSSISIAIIAQKLFKRIAFVYQGLLGGMALVHLTMMQFFFDSTMNFISKYSHFSEIYYSLFSLLIVLSVISTFDKFDLARLDVDQLKDICKDYVVSAIAIPLYLTTLCLHEIFANVDDKLTLIHYQYFNNTSWNDTMHMEEIFDELTTWKKVNISKDLLVILGWFFVAIGIREDTLLIHLESMQGSAETTYIK
ncbi:uncharacterized protein LOC118446512 [Vespa mandarinia]|uniref:uncharacterized protein LOC118446512 n=1 Tax=Vespa mandarinia TaxID=7446 RepID=UPI00162056E1|nr:uncharacterized protein LOC118446512 [Vespa mandarinia]